MIVVLTHPRPDGVSYLQETLASIDASATSRRWVVTDTTSHRPEIPEPWRLHAFDRPVTQRPENRWALWRAFRLAVEKNEDLVVFEDDVTVCKNGAAYAEKFLVPPDVAWVSLYDPWLAPGAPSGLWRARAQGFMYAQAIKFPLSTCRLFGHLDIKAHPLRGSDDQLAAWGRLLNLSYAIHTPSLVQHVGDVSAVGNGSTEGRTSRSYIADRDAFKCDPRRYV